MVKREPAIDRIQPGALYETPEVADILGLHPKTVYAIPERDLHRTRVGPKRRLVKIRGRDLLRYLGIDEEEAA